MKKILKILLLIILTVSTNAYATKQDQYICINQWGALEDILNDFKANKITTDECALYGCYVLIAQEPSRIDRKEKNRLLPSKYKINKKSVSADPYFFIDFLYANENNFSEKVLNEFRKSDWSDYEILEKLKTDAEILKVIENMPLEKTKGGFQYRSIGDIVKNIVDKNLISPEAGYLIIFECVYFENWFKEKNKMLVLKYKITSSHSYDYMPQMYYCSKKFNNNFKLTNLIKYFYSARNRNEYPKYK